MSISDKFTLPRSDKTSLVYGRTFNEAVERLESWLRYDMDSGLYPVHPDQLGGSFPDIMSAIEQGAKEQPDGRPVNIGLWPEVQYSEDIVITQEMAEAHDFNMIGPFPAFHHLDAGLPSWEGDLVLPATSRWPSGRRKSFSMRGVLASHVPYTTMDVHEGWCLQLREVDILGGSIFQRWYGAEGSIVSMNQVRTGAEMYILDQDDSPVGGGGGGVYIDRSLIYLLDFPMAAVSLRGPTSLMQVRNSSISLLNAFGTGFLDMNGGAGRVLLEENYLMVVGFGAPGLFSTNVGAATIDWHGQNTIEIPEVVAPMAAFDIGGPWSVVHGWPECRLQGIFPANPPNGCRASDDTVDYTFKTWSGAAWV